MGRAARAARLLPGEGNLNLYRCVSGSVFTKEKQAQRTGLYLLFVSQTSCDLQAADPALRSTQRHCCLQTLFALRHRRPGFPRSDPRVHLLGLPDPGGSPPCRGEPAVPAPEAAPRKGRLPAPVCNELGPRKPEAQKSLADGCCPNPAPAGISPGRASDVGWLRGQGCWGAPGHPLRLL